MMYMWKIIVVMGCFQTYSVEGIHERANDRVSSKIYKNIKGGLACFRRMNGTHQIGCSSSMNGNVGVIHVVDDQDETKEEFDVNWITSQGPHSPYVAVLYPSSFRTNVLQRLSSSGRINGVLFLHRNSTSITEFSTDKSCPNTGYGFYTNPEKDQYCSKWNVNPKTNDLLFYDWGFPIFHVSDSPELEHGDYGIPSILDCFYKYNKPNYDGTPKDWPLCAAQLQSFMPAAVDTPTCLRRSQISQWTITQRKDCDALGDRNLITSLIPSNQSTPYPETDEGSVIVIAARMDAASIFDKIAPGADTAATGLTAVLTILKQLAVSKSIKEALAKPDSDIRNVYFILFNGEAFDYIGSSKVVYDMARDKFPMHVTDNTTFFPALLRMSDIKYYIELNQLALQPSESYYIHQNLNASSASQSTLSTLIKNLTTMGEQFRLNLASASASSNLGVPPSSLQSFLGNNSDFPGIVITNHDKQFRNKFYNSIFDDDKNIGFNDAVESIARLAATISCTIEELILGKSDGKCSFSKDILTVNNTLSCYAMPGKCDLFENVTTPDVMKALGDKPIFYVGVASNNNYNVLTGITRSVIAFYQNVTVNKTEKECHAVSGTQNVNYIFANGSCYETTILVTPAVSPAFEIENYDWASGQYSSWTESVWSSTMSVRIFLKPSFTHEIVTFFSGLGVFCISFVLAWWVNKKTDVIFPSRYVGYAPVAVSVSPDA